MKIWHQSLTSINRVPQYRDAIMNHVSRVARPDVEVVLHGMQEETYPTHYPGHFITHSYLQNLHREQFVRAALMAEAAGYDAMFIGTIPDVGLLEARTLVDIPVVGYGQASFHMASMLGDCIGVVNFLTPLADELRQNAARYGLGGKLDQSFRWRLALTMCLQGSITLNQSSLLFKGQQKPPLNKELTLLSRERGG